MKEKGASHDIINFHARSLSANCGLQAAQRVFLHRRHIDVDAFEVDQV